MIRTTGNQKVSRQEATNGELGNYFAAIDKNKDSQISKEELDSFAERYPSMVDSDTEEAE